MKNLSRSSGHRVDALLINPSFELPWSKCEPTGLLYVATYLASKGIKVKILDLNVEDIGPGGVLEMIKLCQPQIVGITALTRQALTAYSLGKTIKRSCKDIKLVYGGVHPTFLPEECFVKGAADYVVVGEGEQTTYDLLCHLSDGTDVDDVQGIAYRKADKIVLTKERALIRDLDALPFPDYTLVPLQLYNSTIHLKEYQDQAIHIMSSRGCPNNCVYCCSPRLYRQRVRFRSAENILDEIESIIEKHGIRNIHFHDDNFMLNPQRVSDFCAFVTERRVNFNWICLARTDTIVTCPEILPAMRQAGCVGIEIGVETGDEFVWHKMNRMQPNLDHIRVANELMKSNDIKPMYLIISYGVGENIDSAYKTTRFYYELKLERDIEQIPAHDFDKEDPDLGGHLMRPSPGTAFYDFAHEVGVCLATSWQDHLEQNMTFIPNELLADVPTKNCVLDRQDLIEILDRYRGNLLHYMKNDLYISVPIVEEKFGDIDAFIGFLCSVYESCDGRKTTKELSDELEQDYGADLVMVVSALAMLSILRLVRSREARQVLEICDVKALP